MLKTVRENLSMNGSEILEILKENNKIATDKEINKKMGTE